MTDPTRLIVEREPRRQRHLRTLANDLNRLEYRMIPAAAEPIGLLRQV